MMAAALAVMVWSISTCAAAGAMTSRSLEALSAKAANDRAKRDLLSILRPTSTFNHGNRTRVTGIAMRTVPHGTPLKGMCSLDELRLDYTSTTASGEPMDQPLRPIGVEARPLFHVTKGPVVELRGAAIDEVWNRGCPALRSDGSVAWFPAADFREAAKAANALVAATDAIRSGRLRAKDCDDMGSQACEAAILAGGQVDKIENIGRDCSASAGQECFFLFMGGLRLTIVATFDEDSIAPNAVVYVSADRYVTVT